MRNRIRRTTNLGNGFKMTESYSSGEFLIMTLLKAIFVLPFKLFFSFCALPFKILALPVKIFKRH